jgi:DNA-binding MarR family transcriptional regulator
MTGIIHNHGCVIARIPPSLLDLLSLSGGALDGYVIHRLEAAGYDGLRVRHGYVFQRLMTGDHTVTELARSLRVTQQAMSKTIAELERLGYVVRREDDRDARRRVLTLTPKAEGAVDTARAARRDLMDRLRREVGAQELGAAEHVMTVILDLLGVGAHLSAASVPDPSRR